jgi:hypothetical protein
MFLGKYSALAWLDMQSATIERDRYDELNYWHVDNTSYVDKYPKGIRRPGGVNKCP